MKIAVVTGAARGLGLAWCRQLAKNGYEVVLTARKMEQAEAAAAALLAEGLQVHPYALEVTDEQQLAGLGSWLGASFGQLDLLVNNAGVNPKDYANPVKKAQCFTLESLDAAAMLEVLHINSLAPLLAVKQLRPLLVKSERPQVVNISSWLGSVNGLQFGGHYGYVGSKNLLNVLNKSMAYELRADGIICVNVNPGWVQTDMGGSKAPRTADQAVQELIEAVVNRVTIADTGKFLHYDGTEHPW